jgi:hypothetical protein
MEGIGMDKYNIAGILRTYAERCVKAENDKQLREIVKRLKEDLREVSK